MGTSTCARGARRSVGGFPGLAREVREIRRGGKRGEGGSCASMPSILPLQGVLGELPLNIFARTKYSDLSLNKHWPRGESIHKLQMKETKMQGVGVKPALFTLQGYLLLFVGQKIF